jgi:hypothetical protein
MFSLSYSNRSKQAQPKLSELNAFLGIHICMLLNEVMIMLLYLLFPYCFLLAYNDSNFIFAVLVIGNLITVFMYYTRVI